MADMNYTLIRSRRRTLSVQVKDGTVLVKAPLRLSQREIDRFVEEKAGWIAECLQKYRTALDDAGGKLTDEQVETLVDLAKDVFRRRVSHFAPLVGVSFGRISVRCQKTRWGSCSKEGNLSFNAALLMAPPEVLDSVVVHELCHRLEMNHSERFYAEVFRVMPDYPQNHRWLKEHGQALLLRMP